MAVGIVFLDDRGRVWTVEAAYSLGNHSLRGLRFSRPTFLDAVEQWSVDAVPACWPNCDPDELRAILRSAAHAER